ncbi:DUF2793 domain-containing protein [Novosphingobium soli]|uniref:DUF2793 domain-containing protein n=1 Tax=Novosphingobium soli TaxID=574956 RepID=A0ABV6CRZ7_9SPHN
MTDPFPFASATSRFALPLLHAGQAEKEVVVNEALARADALMHCAIQGETATPPEFSVDGQAWLVAAGATEAWQGQAGSIARRHGSGWIFAEPCDGLRVFDLSAGQEMLFFGGWRKASLPLEPLGGTSVDGEARAAINDLVSALQALGIFPAA